MHGSSIEIKEFVIYYYCDFKLTQKLLMKTPIILLVLVAAFFGYKLMIFSQEYYNEVFSIRLFNMSISQVSMQDENELFITLNLTNPSLKNVKVVSIIYDVYYEERLIGRRYLDLSSKPLILEAQSTLNYENSIKKIDEIKLYEGMHTHIKVKITIETSIFGLVHKETEIDYVISY